MSADEDSAPISFERRTSQSGQVDYGPPVILHDSSRMKIQMIPFYVPRSDRTETAIKLECYRKGQGEHNWVLARERTINLNEAATRKFVRSASAVFSIAEDAAGEFVLIRVSEGTAHLGSHSPETVARAIMSALGQKEIVAHLEGLELSEEITRALKQSIRLSEMKHAVAALRASLDAGEASERVYQDWCEDHYWAFGNAYVVRDDVRTLSPSDQVDAILKHTASGLRDIVEIKRPDMRPLLYDDGHRNYYFSADASKAIGQCHRYLDVFAEEGKAGLRDHREIVAYHPRAIIVIGRSSEWSDSKQRALHGLNSRLHGITVMTFDHLLQQAERLIEIVKPVDTRDDVASENFGDDLDDEIPF